MQFFHLAFYPIIASPHHIHLLDIHYAALCCAASYSSIKSINQTPPLYPFHVPAITKQTNTHITTNPYTPPSPLSHLPSHLISSRVSIPPIPTEQSIHPSIHPSIHSSIHPSIHPSIAIGRHRVLRREDTPHHTKLYRVLCHEINTHTYIVAHHICAVWGYMICYAVPYHSLVFAMFRDRCEV
jgi:hypothetical protein